MEERPREVELSVSLGWTPLHLATHTRDLHKVRTLLSQVCDINGEDKFKRTPLTIAAHGGDAQLTTFLVENGALLDKGYPLHYAAAKGHLDIVRYLIKEGADVNLVKDQNYPLIIAANYGHLELAKFLVDHGADVHVTDDTKSTALHAACHSGNTELITFLVDSGCDINAMNKYDVTPLQVCISYKEQEPHLVKLLLDNGASINKYDSNRMTYLHDSENPVTTSELIKHGAKVNAVDIRNETPLFSACEYEHFECGKVLLQHGADPTIVGTGGWTALHDAARWGDLEMVRALSERGADVNAASARNVVPLHMAVKEGHVEVVRLLLEKGSLVEVPTVDVPDVNSFAPARTDQKGETPESLAEQLQNQEIGEILRRAKGANNHWPCNCTLSSVISNDFEAIEHLPPNSDILLCSDLMGWSPLHHSVFQGHHDMSSELIKKGVSVNAQDRFGRTPLSIAASKNDLRLVTMLLDNGSDVALGLPLHHAIQTKAVETVRELVKRGCDVNAKNRTIWGSSALMEAVSNHMPEVVQLLIDHNADVNAVDLIQQTALHVGAQVGDLECVTILVDKGANVNAVDKCKDTPLSCAAANSSHQIVKVLIDAGADINWRDSSGWTPLHRAVRDENKALELISAGADVNHFSHDVESPLFYAAANPQSVRLLLEHNADPHYSTFSGWTPLHESANEGKIETIGLLSSHGVNINTASAENVMPIYVAAIRGHVAFVRELLDRGSYLDPVIMDLGAIRIEHSLFTMEKMYHIVVGNTPLLGAAAKGHLEVVKLLVARGADLGAINAQGNGALHEAVIGGFKDLVEFLVAVGVDSSSKKRAMELTKDEEIVAILS